MSDTYVPMPIEINTDRVKEVFDSETVSNENTFLLRFMASMYDSDCLKGDYHGRFSSSVSTFDAGSVNGVRVFINKSLVRQQGSEIRSTRMDQLRGLLRSRSSKPKMLVAFADFVVGAGQWSNSPLVSYRKGDLTPSPTHVLIEKNGLVLGVLAVMTSPTNTYKLHILNAPYMSNSTGKAVTIVDAQALTELKDAFEIASNIINEHSEKKNSRRFNALDSMAYCSEWASNLYGISTLFDIDEISRKTVNDTLVRHSRERVNLISRLTNIARNIAITERELVKLNSGGDNYLDVNSIQHPLIDFAYVEAKLDGNQYPVIHIHTKIMAMFPDTGHERYPDYNPQMGIPCGRFNITIDFNDQEVVRFANETYPDGVRSFEAHMQHPHVFGGRNACWGNFGETLSDLISKFDIIGLVDLCMLFLQQANNGDTAGQHWPTWAGTPEYPELVTEYLEQQKEAA